MEIKEEQTQEGTENLTIKEESKMQQEEEEEEQEDIEDEEIYEEEVKSEEYEQTDKGYPSAEEIEKAIPVQYPVSDIEDQINQLKEYEKQMKQLYDIIDGIFTTQAGQNIQRLGLIYLAPALKHHENLCHKYVEILLAIPDHLRKTIMQEDHQVGYLVMGMSTQKYKITTLDWYSLGVCKALASIIQDRGIISLEESHFEILCSAISKPEPLNDWLTVFDSMKKYLYAGLTDIEVSKMAVYVLKGFIGMESIQDQVLDQSKTTLLEVLGQLYKDQNFTDERETAEDFLKQLYWEFKSKVQNFVYVIIKDFADKYPNQFTQGNLMDIMNEIVAHRRGDIFATDLEESQSFH